jgi:secreted protein with Ig-like and vWFA domain
MKKFTALAALPLIAACALPPEGVSSDQLSGFDAAVASIGCDLGTEGQYQAVEVQTGLTRTQQAEIAAYRVAQEQAVQLSNGGVRLTSGACAPEAEPAAEPDAA